MINQSNVVFEIDNDTNKSPPLWGSARLCYTICAFLAMTVHVCLRNTLNFAVLCMVKPITQDNATIANSTIKVVQCPSNHGNSPTEFMPSPKTGDIEWTRSQEFALVGTFYYGYLVSLPIAGRLADRFGGKLLFVHSITAQSVVYMMIPYFARISYVATVILRILQGLIAGFGNPALYQLFAIWAHSSERTSFLSFAYGGYSVGALVAFPITSFLCKYGWELAFYVVGGVALVFGLCCQFLIYSTLEDHPRISTLEFEYLKSTRVEKSETGIPWRDILTSVPVHAFILTHLFQSYGISVFTLLMPIFFKEAMHMNLTEVGIWSSAPFFGSLLSKFITVLYCSNFERRNSERLTLFRRIVFVASNALTIFFLFGMTFFDCNAKLLVVFSTVCVGITTDIAFSGAYWPSLLFIAPKFAGLISGIANCFGQINGFLAPVLIAKIVVNETKGEWDRVMYTLMLAYLLGALVYGSFGSSNLEEWSKPKEDQNRNSTTST